VISIPFAEIGLGLVLLIGLRAVFKWGSVSADRKHEKRDKENAEEQADQVREAIATDDDWERDARDHLRRTRNS
jgi:hypothetical protein